MKRKYILAGMSMGILLCTGLFASAQEKKEGGVVVERKLVERSGSALVVDMTINISSIDVGSNYSVLCYPVVQRGDSLAQLPPLVINGRNRHILYERMGRGKQQTGEFEVRRKNGTEQRVDYHAVIPFREWMQESEFAMVTDLCGCGWKALQNDKVVLFPIDMMPPVVLKPAMAYLAPKAEAVKARAKEGSAFLDFPVNKVTIDPEYRNNPQELARIRETVESVRNDKYATITEVHIKGYASPEGRYDNNAYLAESRAKALRDYVEGLYSFGNARLTVDFEPEDWAGLERRVEETDLMDKDEVLAIIRADEPKDWDKREWRLKTLNGGTSYRILLRDIYPALRHSDYTVEYTIRNFSVEEAKDLLYTDPRQLSLDEMYRVAQTFEPGSREFNEVFEIAVRMYPDDPVSNLNAAVTALSRKEVARARVYLQKAEPSDEKTMAEASAYMLEGDWDKAERLFKSVETNPDLKDAVAANLEQIKQKRKEENNN